MMTVKGRFRLRYTGTYAVALALGNPEERTYLLAKPFYLDKRVVVLA